MAQTPKLARAGPTLRDKWTIGFGLEVVCELDRAAPAGQAGAMLKMDRGPLCPRFRLLRLSERTSPAVLAFICT